MKEKRKNQEEPFSDYFIAQENHFEKKNLKKKEWRFIVDYCLSNQTLKKKYLTVLIKNPDYYFNIIQYLDKKEENLIDWVKSRMSYHEIVWGEENNINQKIKDKFNQIRKLELNGWRPKKETQRKPGKLELKLKQPLKKDDSIQLEFDF